jgi:hypothetical protein
MAPLPGHDDASMYASSVFSLEKISWNHGQRVLDSWRALDIFFVHPYFLHETSKTAVKEFFEECFLY